MTTPSLADLERDARAGNARAQYVLAAHLGRLGRSGESENWLQSAARVGEPDALYTLATRELKSTAGVRAAAELLQRASLSGSASATRLLAVLKAEGLGAGVDWIGACRDVLKLAHSGDFGAQREIAGLLYLADASDADADALTALAAPKDPVAAAMMVRVASLRRVFAANELSAALRLLKSVNYPRMHALERLKSKASASRASAACDWGAVAVKCEAALGTSAPAPQPLSRTPTAFMVKGAFAPQALEYLIGHSALRLGPSLTADSRTGEVRKDDYRSSMTATLGPVDQDLFIVAVNRRLAAIADVPFVQGEFLSVLRYAPGQEYRPHFDWLGPGPDFDRGGQRIRTALLYLNDDYAGGETHFLQPKLSVKGAPGDVLVFHNVLLDGAGDMASRHAGLPVLAGVKWLASKWFRERAYEF